MVVLLGAINIVGVKESAGVNVFFAVADFMTQVVLVIVGCVLVLDPDLLVRQVDFGTTPTLGDFLIAIPVAMVAYTGIETVSNMAEEAKDYGSTIPRGIGLVVGAVAVIYTFLPAVALSAMPVKDGETVLALSKEQGGYADDPILGVVENMDLGSLQHPAEIYVGILAATILFIATNAGIIGVSRLSYSMGQHRQLPELLRALHPKFRTPYVAIAIFGLVACVAILPGQADFLGVIYAFGAMLSFTMAHAAVARLRFTQPDRRAAVARSGQRPSRRDGGALYALFGGLGTGTALIVATALDLRVLVSGLLWLALGCLLYVVYRRSQGLPLTQTVKIVTPQPVVEHEVEYQSVLVAFEEGAYSSEAVAMAARLAAKGRRGIHVLVTITVPPNSPIDAVLPEQEASAQSMIDSARVRGGRRVTGHWEKVRPGQAGRRVVEEAREIDARALVMSLPPRRTGMSLFGKTIETVLAERPCRVIIDSSRGRETAGRAA